MCAKLLTHIIAFASIVMRRAVIPTLLFLKRFAMKLIPWLVGAVRKLARWGDLSPLVKLLVIAVGATITVYLLVVSVPMLGRMSASPAITWTAVILCSLTGFMLLIAKRRAVTERIRWSTALWTVLLVALALVAWRFHGRFTESVAMLWSFVAEQSGSGIVKYTVITLVVIALAVALFSARRMIQWAVIGKGAWRFVLYSGLTAGVIFGILTWVGIHTNRNIFEDIRGTQAVWWLTGLIVPVLGIVTMGEHRTVRKISIVLMLIIFFITTSVINEKVKSERPQIAHTPTPQSLTNLTWDLYMKNQKYETFVTAMDDEHIALKVFYVDNGTRGAMEFSWNQTESVGTWRTPGRPQHGTWKVRKVAPHSYSGFIDWNNGTESSPLAIVARGKR